ncbi:Kef-type transport system (probable substrate potassium) (plasmid) [Natrialba magadii ATCC 43099]|uniref:Kef-type transport system (Probable substrate potassium) n=1 Tax=Natrialba magadii (strain ATCC 43099 / DSM 3394 / CCM 3739 / CIP 104546 / IAM 13178 / JCM 8861 / NBRC 102185 / NCIMB 2190 / MS3) TaxID=547559 RepID=D3T234_NATMM|nr:cation:proton antiporter [Natrialba magadii]ADD07643.1 Kef-type transport system (probable substrate potassium) [Natrialba magadii ATCC 43099]ELY27123.1 TrkA-N domain-containing protein [Natrialba magadii ATCC 43099]
MTDVALLTALAILFVVVGPLLLIAKGLRLSLVPSLILAGLLVGQLGVIEEETMLELARLGIAFLVFTFSVQIHTERVRTVVSDTEVVAIVQALALGTLGICFALLVGVALELEIFADVALEEPLTVEQALFVGIAAALSSSIVGTALFTKPQSDIVHDYLSREIDSFNDLLAVFLLLVVSAGTFALDPIATQLGYGVILLATAIVVNRYLFGIVERLARGSDEAMLVSIVALLIVFLAAAEFLETSIVVGAFAAGLAVRNNPVEYSEVFNGLTSIQEFFVAIFFATVGALVTLPSPTAVVSDPTAAFAPFVPVATIALGLVVLTVVVKPIVTGILLVYNGYDRRSATVTGLDLDHVGEFSVIVAIEALVLGLLIRPVFYAIILAAAVSMILSNLTHTYDEEIYGFMVSRGWLGQPYHDVHDWNSVPENISDHVIIVGYGRQGRRLVEFCEEVNQPYVVIENNPQALPNLRADCDAYVFGDAIEPETAGVANLEDSRLVISTVESKPLTEYFLSFTDTVDVIVRTRELPMAAELIEQGATYVIVPDLLAADQLADSLEALLSGEYDLDGLRTESMRELDVERAPPSPSAGESISYSGERVR